MLLLLLLMMVLVLVLAVVVVVVSVGVSIGVSVSNTSCWTTFGHPVLALLCPRTQVNQYQNKITCQQMHPSVKGTARKVQLASSRCPRYRCMGHHLTARCQTGSVHQPAVAESVWCSRHRKFLSRAAYFHILLLRIWHVLRGSTRGDICSFQHCGTNLPLPRSTCCISPSVRRKSVLTHTPLPVAADAVADKEQWQ